MAFRCSLYENRDFIIPAMKKTFAVISKENLQQENRYWQSGTTGLTSADNAVLPSPILHAEADRCSSSKRVICACGHRGAARRSV